MQQDLTFDDVTLDGGQEDNRYALDHKLHVTFYLRPMLNAFKSEQEGRKIYDEVEYIKIFTPGSQLCSIDAPVTAGTYLHRFRDKYAKWKAGQAELISGTPLDAFPMLIGKVGLVAELNAMNIRTVEQLADLSDGYLQKIMGGNDLRAKAKAFIEGTSGTDATLAKIQKENEELKAQMANLTTMFGAKEQQSKKDKVA
jgi:hypothetical protein